MRLDRKGFLSPHIKGTTRAIAVQGSRKFWAVVTAALCLAVCSPGVLAGTSQVKGEVVIKYEAKQPSEPLHAPSGATATGKGLSYQHTMTTTVNVCIQRGETAITDVSHDLNYLQEKDVKVVYNKTDCSPVHRTRSNADIRRPGNWEHTTEKVTKVMITPEEAEKTFKKKLTYKPAFSLRYVSGGTVGERKATQYPGGMIPGKYSLFVDTRVLAAMSGEMRTKRHNVCTGVSTEDVIEFKPLPFGEKGYHTVTSGDNGTRVVIGNPYDFWNIGTGAGLTIDFDPHGSSGSQTLYHDKKSRTEQKLSVHWQFKPNDPCQELINAIRHDLAYTEAFLDPTVRAEAKDINQYKCYADRRAYEIYYGSPPPKGLLDCDGKTGSPGSSQENSSPGKPQTPDSGSGGDRGVGDEIGVDGKCNLVREKEYREKARKNCTLDEVVEAVIAHEKTHQAQCKTDNDRYRATDLNIRGDMEVAAHLIGVDHMLKSLKRLCPEYETSLVEEKIREINRKRLMQ